MAVGLVVTYIWRFHEVFRFLEPLRPIAIFTVLSWTYLVFAPNWPILKRSVSHPSMRMYGAWVGWVVIGGFMALSSEVAFHFIRVDLIKTILFLLFILSAISTPKDLRMLTLASSFGAAVGAFFYIKGGMPAWGSSIPLYDINDFALVLNMTLPLVLWEAMRAKQKAERVFFWVLAVMIIVSVIGTSSRGGFLTLLTVGTLTAFHYRKIGVKAILGVALLVVLTFSFAPDSYWDRMSTILNLEEDYNTTSDIGRKALWERGWQYTKDNPVFGLGVRNFPYAEGTMRPEAQMGYDVKFSVAHNSFMEVLAETGVVGFFFWCGALLVVLWRLFKVRTNSRGESELAMLPEALFVSIVAYCVGGSFISLPYSPYLYFVVALSLRACDFVKPRLPAGRSRPIGRRRARLMVASP